MIGAPLYAYTGCGGGGLAAGSSPYVREKVIMLTTWTQPRLHGGKSKEDTEEDSSGGSPPRLRGKAFLTRCSTCKMLETHSLSPHSGASRRCPPTVTFAPCSGCSGLGNPPEGFKPVYDALPLPEASAPPTVWRVAPKILGRVIRIPHSGVTVHRVCWFLLRVYSVVCADGWRLLERMGTATQPACIALFDLYLQQTPSP